jgi:hypothetical protein
MDPTNSINSNDSSNPINPITAIPSFHYSTIPDLPLPVAFSPKPIDVNLECTNASLTPNSDDEL